MGATLDLATLRVLYKSEGLVQLNNEFTKLKTNGEQNFGSISKAAGVAFTAVGAGATAAFAASTSKAIDFRSAMKDVGTLGVQDMKGLNDGVLKLSTAMGMDATESAKQLYQAISAGVPEQSAVKTLGSFAKAAKAGVGELSDALNLGTSVINAYGLSYDQTEEVMGTFLQAVKVGKTTVGELGEAVGRVAPTAQAAGVSVKELAAAYAGMTSVGIKTTEASSGLKAALANIIKPSTDAQNMAKELGIEFNVAGLKAKGFSGFLDDVAKKTGGNVEKMSSLFGSVEAVNAVLSLTAGGGAEKFKTALSLMTDGQKTLNETFEAWKRDNPEFAIAQAKAALSELAIRIGTIVLPALASLAEGLKPIIEGMTTFAQEHPGVTKGLVAIAGGLGALSLAVGPVLYTLPTFVAGFQTLSLLWSGGMGAAAAAGGITAVGAAAGTASIGVGALAAEVAVAAAPFLALAAVVTFTTISVGAFLKGLSDVKEAVQQNWESQQALSDKTLQYAQQLENLGAKIDWVKFKQMDQAQQEQYLEGFQQQVRFAGLQSYLETLTTKEKAQAAYTVARNLMMNENLKMEEAAQLATMGLSNATLMFLLNADARQTQSTLENLGIRTAAQKQAETSTQESAQKTVQSNKQVMTASDELRARLDANNRWWVQQNIVLIANNKSVYDGLSADMKRYAAEYIKELQTVPKQTHTTSKQAQGSIKELKDVIADLPQSMKVSGEKTAQVWEETTKRIIDAAMKAREAIKGLSPDVHQSPSPNELIIAGLKHTVEAFRTRLGDIAGLARGTRGALTESLAANIDAASGAIVKTAASGGYGPVSGYGVAQIDQPAVEQRRTPALGAQGLAAGGTSINVRIDRVEKTADIDDFMVELARRMQLKSVAQGA